MKSYILATLCLVVTISQVQSQKNSNPGMGRLTEVYAWRRLSYNIDGVIISQNVSSVNDIKRHRNRRQSDNIYFQEYDEDDGRPYWNTRDPPNNMPNRDDSNTFFIPANNLPMGAERVGNRLFITVPRRRYGIPSTLNYVDLSHDTSRSPALRPYPNLQQSRTLTSVYRTRADECQRLWFVDTGLLEIPGDPQQIQAPAIVVYDLRSDRQLLRYPFRTEDLPAANTPTGLASITVDTSKGCDNTYAYVPDLTTYGLIVFSLAERTSWRLSHNYFHFEPAASTLRVAGQRFQWNDGIFSITLATPDMFGCREAYFHAMASTKEYVVSTCILNNQTASQDSEFWTHFRLVGDRGKNSQSSMHALHLPSGALLLADIGRDALSCWRGEGDAHLLARDQTLLSYPADIHITGDEVWLIANTLPRFIYASLDANAYNFYVYRANIMDLISGTKCAPNRMAGSRSLSHGRYRN